MLLADAVSVGLVECRRGRIAWANAWLARWLGIEEATHLVGRGADTLVADTGEGLPDWSGGEAATPTAAPLVCALQGGEGAPRRVRLRPLGEALWELSDVTGPSGLEGEVHRLGSELLAARRTADSLRARLEREAKDRDELLSVVSHELQTPLTVVAGFTRLLLSEKVGALNPEQRHFLSESTKSCRRLSAFIASLMDAQGESSGGRPLELAEGSLRSTIEAVADMLRPLVQERRQRIRLELQEPADRARFDPMRVEQVMINLLSNALKYGREGGEIAISTRPVDAAGRRFVEVAVSDDGPGVPEADRLRIFEPYVRGGATTHVPTGPRGDPVAGSVGDGKGLGLGLAICKRIVEAHGGALGVTASPTGGARFWFTLEAAGDTGGAAGGRPR